MVGRSVDIIIGLCVGCIAGLSEVLGIGLVVGFSPGGPIGSKEAVRTGLIVPLSGFSPELPAGAGLPVGCTSGVSVMVVAELVVVGLSLKPLAGMLV